MKSILLLLFSLLGPLLLAQTFTEVLDTPFAAARLSSVAFADVDGDNDQDVLITGRDNSTPDPNEVTKLYLNDGFGNYSEVMNTPFAGVIFGSVAFGDIDNDNDQDVLITGRGDLGISIAKLYLNDGFGNFSEVLNTPFEGVYTSSIAFVDIDGDNDQDIFIAGINDLAYGKSNLYLNDGEANFALVQGTPFLGVVDAAIAFADVDGDNDQDVLITGTNSPAIMPGPITNLYINEGGANFSLMNGTPFEKIISGAVAFADVDGDNDQDVLITGHVNIPPTILNVAKLYLNDGVGNYSEMMGNPFEGVFLSSIAFADVDGDNDPDVLITGRISTEYPAVRIAKLYTNDGLGTFSEVLGTPFEAVEFSSVAFADVDGDSDQDVLITGWIESTPSAGISKLYLNENVVAVEEVITGLDLKLYPNPTRVDEINLSFTSEEYSLLQINILDLNGRLLIQVEEQVGFGEQTIAVDISSLAKGSYFIRIDDGDRKGVWKFIVQ
ncbi:MAG: T9SS type A sorting domain-containing protein [Saprospiraceae bacterium]